MKLRFALIASLLAFSGATVSLRAQAPAGPTAAHEDTELGKKMSGMGKAFKKLRSQINDASKNKESVQLVATMKENAVAASKFIPEKSADLPEADQAKFNADFVKKMNALVDYLSQLEVSLKAGDNAAAAKQLEVIGNMQKEGHKEFRKKKPEKK
jgi:soluble cytochrome b562